MHKFTLLSQDKSLVTEDREVHTHLIRVTKEVTRVTLRCKDCEEDKDQENVRFISFVSGDTDLKATSNELKMVRC